MDVLDAELAPDPSGVLSPVGGTLGPSVGSKLTFARALARGDLTSSPGIAAPGLYSGQINFPLMWGAIKNLTMAPPSGSVDLLAEAVPDHPSGQANKRKKPSDPVSEVAGSVPKADKFRNPQAGQQAPGGGLASTPLPSVLSFDLPKELVEQHWASFEGKALIGWFSGRWPSLPQVHKWSERIWKPLGLVPWTISWMGKGFLLFKFQSQADCLKVMAGGPWFLGPNACVLQKWRPFFDPGNPGPLLRPVWIRVKGLPLELWSSSCFQILGNAIGEYICTSRASLAGSFGMDARICVAIDTNKALAPSITMNTNGIAKLLELDYEGIPFRCFACKNTGHMAKDCPTADKTEKERTVKKPTMKWIKKTELNSAGGPRSDRDATPGPFDQVLPINSAKVGGPRSHTPPPPPGFPCPL